MQNRGRKEAEENGRQRTCQSHQYQEGIGLCDQRYLMKNKQLVYKKDNLLIIEN